MKILILANEPPDHEGYRLFREKTIDEMVKSYDAYDVVSEILILGPSKAYFEQTQLDKISKWTNLSRKFKYIEIGETANIAQSALTFFKTNHLLSEAIVLCDTNALVNIDKLLQFSEKSESDISFFAVPFEEIDSKSWSTCAINNGKLVEISSAGLPKGNGFLHGVVGTFYFKSPPNLTNEKSIVEYVANQVLLASVNACVCSLTDIKLYRTQNDSSGYKGTIFCDLDGTLVEHEAIPDYTKPLVLTPGAKEFLLEVQNNNQELVICTARKQSDEKKLRAALSNAGIHYSRLICGLSSGGRTLINDSKPSTVNVSTARSFQISRNAGLHSVVQSLQRKHGESLLAKLSGASGAQTYLVRDKGGNLKIRKEVLISDEGSVVAAAKLSQQFSTMKAYSVAYEGLCPMPYELIQNDSKVSFCMDYIEPENERLPASGSTFKHALEISALLKRTIYNHRGQESNGQEWLSKFMDRKIYPKIDQGFFPKYTGTRHLPLKINSKIVYSPGYCLNRLMSNETFLKLVSPKMLGLTHGDATIQNSIQNAGKIVLIDFEPEDFKQPLELDLGKLYQSALCGYESWDRLTYFWRESRDEDGIDIQINAFNLDEKDRKDFDLMWAEILNDHIDSVRTKGKFYLATHLIRMIPYQAKVNKKRAIYAYLLASQYLQELYEEFQN